MARTVDRIQSDIDAVLAEAAEAEQSVTYADGRARQKRTEADRQKALGALRTELAEAQAATTPRRRTLYLYTDQGF